MNSNRQANSKHISNLLLNRRVTCLTLFAFTLFVSAPSSSSLYSADNDAETVIDVGNQKQVFLDGLFLNTKENVQLVMHKPYRDGQILIKPDQPWEMDSGKKEQRIGLYSCVLKEDGLIRVWYDMARGKMSDEIRVGYAESTDGIHFTKPKLGLHEVDGSKENNVVIAGLRLAGAAVWKDPNASPEHRYKTQTKVYPSGRLRMHSSPDGIHWKLMSDLKVGHIDTQNIILWEPSIERYLLFTRRWMKNLDKPLRYRTVRRLESTDLKNWTNEKMIMEPDDTDRKTHDRKTKRTPVDFYGGGVFKYTDNAYLMFTQSTWAWMDWGDDGFGPATIDVQLAVSRDAEKFQRIGNRRPFISLGPEGRFDSRFIWAMPNPIRMGDEIWIYYAASNRDHTPNSIIDPAAGKELSGIGRAILRLDGFTSVDGDYTGGQFTTPPMQFTGDQLQLNVDAAGGGAVTVELLDKQGQPIPGFTHSDSIPIARNSVRMPVTWKGNPDLAALAGQPIRMRVRITNASLYAFQFVETKSNNP